MGRREGRPAPQPRRSEEGSRALSWSIWFSSRGRKDLRRLDPPDRERVVKALEKLAEEDVGDVKRLQGYDPPQWRLRVGDIRVRFAYRPEEGEILVLRVLPRGKAYDR